MLMKTCYCIHVIIIYQTTFRSIILFTGFPFPYHFIFSSIFFLAFSTIEKKKMYSPVFLAIYLTTRLIVFIIYMVRLVKNDIIY